MADSRKFTRTQEDFICKQCNQEVKGDGYTNHCPHCLWSQHVDINPGDRACECCGMMRPVAVEIRGSEYVIVHQCERCGEQRPNRRHSADNFQVLLAVAKKAALGS